jgi:hypothetical protein
MIFKNLKLSAVFLLFIGIQALKAQEAIPASGGNALGSGGTVSFTVGQVVYTTNNGTNVSVVQGIQQPYEISVVNGLELASGITLQCLVYPNPTIDLLHLKIDAPTSHNLQSMNYQLLDMNGKLLEYRKLTGDVTLITMSEFPMATYFLKISENNIVVKTFKIIKN